MTKLFSRSFQKTTVDSAPIARLIEPVMQILGGPVYMRQYEVNAKAAFNGELWQWRQDHGTWKRDDDMPAK